MAFGLVFGNVRKVKKIAQILFLLFGGFIAEHMAFKAMLTVVFFCFKVGMILCVERKE